MFNAHPEPCYTEHNLLHRSHKNMYSLNITKYVLSYEL